MKETSEGIKLESSHGLCWKHHDFLRHCSQSASAHVAEEQSGGNGVLLWDALDVQNCVDIEDRTRYLWADASAPSAITLALPPPPG